MNYRPSQLGVVNTGETQILCPAYAMWQGRRRYCSVIHGETFNDGHVSSFTFRNSAGMLLACRIPVRPDLLSALVAVYKETT